MHVEAFFDPATYTLTYVVSDPETRDAVVIDPVLDYDPIASRTSCASNEKIIRYVDEQRLNVRLVLETHAHADHLSGSQQLRRRFGVGVVIGARIQDVQATFRDVFQLGEAFATDGSQFDRLVEDGDELDAGSIRIRVLHTPGHTPACVSYIIGDAVFTGDALFLEDYGTGRCDFPMGSADDLYTSVHDKLYRLPDDTRVFVGHDYQPGEREVRWESTIGVQKEQNRQLRASTPRDEFVRMRNERDAGLAAPRLLHQSVQTNIAGGRLPNEAANGVRYFRLPVNSSQRTDAAGVPRA